ncbi:unnamed protein product [Phytophthora fragariaefolia]|uniref:Unnamed protein product n=1 Tax=Phytophthora fragariaefolia TaxID=1490495 RepID=A0A9W6XVZ1_9STRA|nr:unnamed protein product [Phytophthora fragariaefolia]
MPDTVAVYMYLLHGTDRTVADPAQSKVNGVRQHERVRVETLRGREGQGAVRCERRALCVGDAAGRHEGDVNALQFVAARGENLLVSASSAGGVFAFRVSSSSGDDAAMSDGDASKPLSPLAMPQWENVFTGAAATCVEASESRTSLVTASTGGALAWLKLDDEASVEKIGALRVIDVLLHCAEAYI